MRSFFKQAKPPDSRGLEKLIFDVAEHQSGEDFDELYRCLATRTICVPVDLSSLPAGINPGEPYVTKPADQLKMSFVTLLNGMSFAAAATKENAPLLKSGFVHIEWIEFLRMSQKLDSSISGIFLQGETSWVAFDREKIEYILKFSGAQIRREEPAKDFSIGQLISGFFSFFNKKNDTAIVPANHKVVVIHPSQQPYIARCESGVWVADLGQGADASEVISRVFQIASETQKPESVILILQLSVLESKGAFDSFVKELSAIISNSGNTVGHCAVVSYANAHQAEQMLRLKDAGLGVYSSADDGACFVEVHKPEGIVVGMPGRAFAA